MSGSKILKLHKFIPSGCSYNPTFRNWLWKDRRTDTMFIEWSLSTGIAMCWRRIRVGKTVYGAKHIPKQKTMSNSNSVSILGIPLTFSRQTAKCFICTFHEESHAFEDWIFVRLSSLVFASEWTTNQKKFQFNRSISIDLWCQKVASCWFCPLPPKWGKL